MSLARPLPVEVLNAHRDEFKRVFGVNLTTYMNRNIGFKLIAFDLLINPDDENGESTADKIVKEYGEEAKSLVLDIIHSRLERTTTNE